MAYNWHFDTTNLKGTAEAERLFSVPDFVGDACKAIASRIRGAVASVIFDDFHKVNIPRIPHIPVFILNVFRFEFYNSIDNVLFLVIKPK